MGLRQEIVDLSPEYLALGETEETRIREYKEYIEEEIYDRRKEDRNFKEGVYGSKEYIEEMRKKGLRSKWSHRGRPRKQRDEK